jgi:hypothetical protein
MKMFKLATLNVPDGKAIVRLTFKDDGTVKREIIRGGKSECTKEAGGLLEELLNMEIPGYGGAFASVDDAGNTDEFYDQQASHKPMSRPHKQEIKEEDEASPMFGPKQDTREMDSGYNV